MSTTDRTDRTDGQRLAVNGVEISWSEAGQGPGPALVLCHGFTGSSHDFSLQVDALAERRRVLSLDLRGHGRSTKTGVTASYRLDLLSADLVGFIEAVGGGPVDLLGHSMGGVVSMGAVLSRPDLVNSLILMDTSAWSFLPEDGAIRTLVHSFMEAFDPARGIPANFGLGGPEDDLIAATVPAEWQAHKDGVLAGMDAYAIKALGMVLMTGTVGPLRQRLPEITCPVTVIVGQHDHPLVDQAPELAAEVAHGHLSVIPGAYHSPQLTHPDAWRAAVEAHLARVHAPA
jgi:pimeloyl-ACP methyl ester carboxylesterase